MDSLGRDGGGKEPAFDSVDSFLSGVSKLRRSLAEHNEACATLENMVAEAKKEQNDTRAEVKAVQDRVQAMAARAPYRKAVVDNLNSSLVVMIGQLHLEEAENEKLCNEERMQKERLDSLYSHYLTKYNAIRTRYSGRLVDDTQQEYKQKLKELTEKRNAAVSKIHSLVEGRNLQAVKDWAEFRESIVRLLKSRKELQEKITFNDTLESRIKALGEDIQKKEGEVRRKQAEIEIQKSEAKPNQAYRPPKLFISLQENVHKPSPPRMAATTGKLRRDTPRPNRFDSGLGLLKTINFKEKSQLTFGNSPEIRSAKSRAEGLVSTQDTETPSGQSSLKETSPCLKQSPELGQVTCFASQDSDQESTRVRTPRQKKLMFATSDLISGSKINRVQTPASLSSSAGKVVFSDSADDSDKSAQRDSSFGKDMSTTEYMADVSRSPEPGDNSRFQSFTKERSSLSMDKVSSGSSMDVWETPPSKPPCNVRSLSVSSLIFSPDVIQKSSEGSSRQDSTDDLSAADVPSHIQKHFGRVAETVASVSKRATDLREEKNATCSSSTSVLSNRSVDEGTPESVIEEQSTSSYIVEDMEVEVDQGIDYMTSNSPRQSSQGFSIEEENSDISNAERDALENSMGGESSVEDGEGDFASSVASLASSLPFHRRGSPYPFSHSTPAKEAHNKLLTSSLCVEPPISRDVSVTGSSMDTPKSLGPSVTEQPSTPVIEPAIAMQPESAHLPELSSKRQLFYGAPEVSQSNAPVPPPGTNYSLWSSPLYASSLNPGSHSHKSPQGSSGNPHRFMAGGRSEESRMAAGALSLFGSPENTSDSGESKESPTVNFSLFGESQPSQDSDFGGGGFFSLGFGGSQSSPDKNSCSSSSSYSSRGFLSSLFDGSSTSNPSDKDSSSGAGFRLF